MSRPFAPGELALLLDPEGKRYMVRLAENDTLHHHLGAVQHADVIGQPEGARIRSSQGKDFAALRPRLLDYVFEMPRRSGIVYPKDAAHLMMWADIGPGMRVLESGVGSGALTLALLRAVGERGQVVGYEQRPDFLDLALSNVRAFSEAANLLLRERDVYEGIVDDGFDRVVLDLPEPWRVVPHLQKALRSGGCLAAYTPSILQAAQITEALRATQQYVQLETHEVLLRGWHIRGQAVRPEQQMVGHTGFVTVARQLAGECNPGARGPVA
ncbi:MAG: tRNA (adenine-N1)-methyltransferase [Chloroflexi bacterium]|nr:tRNA (adenine-N1)-methyltransferase [Chloroflexota bacterium]